MKTIEVLARKIYVVTVLMLSLPSVHAQDIITYADTGIYMFNPLPAEKDLRSRQSYSQCGSLYGGIYVQQYVPHDTVIVYGVALTMRSKNLDGTPVDIDSSYRAVLMQRAAGMPDSNEYGLILRPLQYVDYISLDTINVKRCLFQYEYDYPSPYTSLVPCYEFYFNTPMKINQMTDTFYVGREKFFVDGGYYYPSEYSGKYTSDPIVSDYWYVGYTDTTRFYNLSIYNERLWGFSFPIIGFHCGPLDEENHSLLLTNVGNNSAVVQWYNGGECGTYNVRLTSHDGTMDTIVVTEDSVCTFTNLPLYKRYTVQVRKQCRYATVNYDTTVYGPWTTENPSFVTGEPCTPISDVQATISGSSAMVTWTGFPHYSSLRLRYGYINQEESQWQEVDVTGDTVYFITGLESGRMYGVSLKAYCDFYEWEMPWSAPVTFYVADTSSGGGTDGVEAPTLLSQLTFLQPNPAQDEVTVTSSFNLIAIDIWTADGVMVYHGDKSGHDAVLDVSYLRAGTYIVAIHTHNGTTHKKLQIVR